MPSFRRKASFGDAESAAETAESPASSVTTPTGTDRRVDPALARTLAEEAEAEAAEAEALAAAARARARAAKLRRQAQEAEDVTIPAGGSAAEAPPVNGHATDESDPIDTESDTQAASEPAPDGHPTAAADLDGAQDVGPVEEDYPDTAVDETVAGAADPKPARRRLNLRVPLPTWKGAALVLATLCACALLAASGFMIIEHRRGERQAQLTAEYSAAGRQAVVTLMSLDFNTAEEDVQRIIDNSTGKFREDFQAQAETFAQVALDSKVITEVTVNTAAVKSMDDNTAAVLVSATSRITNSAGAQEDPRGWRLLVDLERDGDQVKMSRVEFVP